MKYLIGKIGDKWEVLGPQCTDPAVELGGTVDSEIFDLLDGFPGAYTIENGIFRQLMTVEQVRSEKLRARREAECFPVINRGALWYDKLTAEQRSELSAWYEAWLDAPQTGVAPSKPTWLESASKQS